MDDVLRILEADARTSASTIARMTGRTEADVRAAISELESSGVIKSYKTIIDWDRFGATRIFAFIDVKVLPQRDVGFDQIAKRIYQQPEVHSVWLVSGDYDLRVVVEGRSVQDVGTFVTQKLASLERVQGTSTHFLLKRYKEDRVMFEDDAVDPRLAVSP